MGSHGTVYIILVDITKPTQHMPQGILFLPKPSLQGKVISPPSSSNNFSANGTVWTPKMHTIYSIHILHLYTRVCRHVCMHMHIHVVTLYASIFYCRLVIKAKEKKITLLLYDMFPLISETQPLRLLHLCWHQIDQALQKEVFGVRILLCVKPHTLLDLITRY